MSFPKITHYQETPVLIGIVALGMVFLFASLGFFTFPAADDFAYFDQVNRFGFWGAQREWYAHWSGRFSATAVASLFALLPNTVSYYVIGPLVTIMLTCGSIFTLFAALGRRSFCLRTIAVSSLVFSVIFISGLPNISQSIYWVIGAATYQFGNIALVLLMAVAAQRELMARKSPICTTLLFVIAALLAVYAIGTNELTLIAAVTFVFAMFFVAVRFKRESMRFWLAVSLVALVAAFLSISCPGNFIRERTLFNNGYIRPPIWVAATIFIPWIALRVINWTANPAIWVSTLILYFATREQVRATLYRDGRFQKNWLWVPAIWLLLLVITNCLGFAINHYPLPDRAEAVVYLIFLLGCYPVSIIFAHRFIPTDQSEGLSIRSWANALLVISMVGSPSAFEAVKDVYRGHRYWVEMSGRFELIRRAVDEGRLNPVVPSVTRLPRTIAVTELSTDSDEVANKLLSEFYGLQSIRIGDPATNSNDLEQSADRAVEKSIVKDVM